MSRSARAKRVWIAITGLGAAGILIGAFVVSGWVIDETHFDRPDGGFDRLAAQIDDLPGVSVDATERWVEAPVFLSPTSRMEVSVDQQGLPGLLDAACAAEYPDAVTWSVRVRTGAGDVVALQDPAVAATTTDRTDRSGCIDVGFDAVALVGEVDRVRLGVDVQVSIWEGGRFALVALEEGPGSIRAVLPLVAHGDELRVAAGLDPSLPVEVNAQSLGLIVQPDEFDGYSVVLSDLVEEHGVTSFWAEGGSTSTDGVDRVQIVAPDEEHAAIEAAVRTSGLRVAGLPVHFIPQS
ncbi:hypothetical protein [Herbiconiux sp. YIM B11900]|uniref:hypothetical protein n=1 Tax=Herbiconiux sp. YIM B11900 TaxID=3404131 RepID=UPI003F87BB1B